MRGSGLIRFMVVLLAAAGLVTLGALAAWTVATAQHQHASSTQATEKPTWLVKLSPAARTEAIQRQLRGFETTMAEVAYRYTEMYWGGVDGNWGYAEHMAHEMGNAMTLGLERRPQYRKNADALFLKGPYVQVMDAIKAKDPDLFKQRIETMRAACTACHAAEAHPYIKIGVPTVRRNPVVND